MIDMFDKIVFGLECGDRSILLVHSISEIK